uniref:VPS37 C-terminal domain-containing protein n=1 Tax=Electrophorus electricus TaxID=8005 RepID=A0A4W4E5Z8_ELEEL
MSHRWDFTTHLERFRCLNSDQLRDLLEDEESLERIIRRSPKGLQRQKELKWGFNRRLAERNFSYRPCLKHGKRQLVERHRALGDLVASVKQKQSELGKRLQTGRQTDRLCGQLSLKTTRRFQEERVNHLDLWNRFINGDMLLAEFVESFRSARKLYHKRIVEAEKMHELTGGRRADARDVAGPRARALRAPHAVHVFHHLAPVVMVTRCTLSLTGHSVKSRCLPPLNRHGQAASWTPSVCNYNPDYSPESSGQPQNKASKDHPPKHPT